MEQENCLTSSYVQMNIPYADFYKAAGVDNASEIDAVTSATKNKTRAGNLAAGSYHVNADGSDKMCIRDRIGHPVDLRRRHAGIRQKFPHQRSTLLLLILSIGVTAMVGSHIY